jgi:hypothetical protein
VDSDLDTGWEFVMLEESQTNLRPSASVKFLLILALWYRPGNSKNAEVIAA